MATVARNFVANLAGNAWGTLLSLLIVPVYLKFLGAEGYGLIGFYLLVSTLLSVLDVGFSATVNRELASSSESSRRGLAGMIRTLERGFFAISLVIAIIVFVLAPQIATHWLNVHELSIGSAIWATRLMAGLLLMQFPIALYNGCLLGLQRHDALNAIGVCMSTVRAVGAIAILWAISRSVEAFFAWQLFVTLANLVIVRAIVMRLVPRSADDRGMSIEDLRRVGSFALGMGAINMLGLVITQLDRVVLSALVPLKLFGYYALAWTAASVIYRLSGPVFTAILPRMTQLASRRDASASTEIFLKSGQLMATLVVPVSLFLAIFAQEVLAIWTHDPAVAAADGVVLAMLAGGTMISAILQVPVAYLVGAGTLRPLLWINFGAAVAFVPLLGALVMAAGIEGAAASWLILNVGLCIPVAFAIVGPLGPAQFRRWAIQSVVLPVCVCLAFLVPVAAVIHHFGVHDGVMLTMILAAAGVVCEGLVLVSLPMPRTRIVAALKRFTRDPKSPV